MPAAAADDIKSPEQVEADIAKKYAGQPRGFPFGDFELDDVMVPDGDDMGIASEDDDAHNEEEIVTETGFGSVIGAYVVSWHDATARHSAQSDPNLCDLAYAPA